MSTNWFCAIIIIVHMEQDAQLDPTFFVLASVFKPYNEDSTIYHSKPAQKLEKELFDVNKKLKKTENILQKLDINSSSSRNFHC